MDALIKSLRPGKPSEVKSPDVAPETRPAELDPSEFLAAAVRADQPRPSRAEAEQAVQTLLSYIGENPDREGLLDTPRRVVEAFDELYQGYHQCPAEVLDRTFGETAGYDDFVLIRDIEFTSQCEHHMMPFYGKAHIAYTPVERVVGLSKLARLTDIFARRLQTQEHLTAQIAAAIDEVLKPRGVAVMIEAEHTCMSVRGVAKHGAIDVHQPLYRHVPRQSGGAGAFPVHGARAAAGNPRSKFREGCPCPHLHDTNDREEGLAFQPKFDASGLVTCVATDAATGDVLMVAHMNDEALRKTIASGEAWYFSRSRNALWRKGETQVRPSAWSRCGWIAIRTRSGSGSSSRRGLSHRAALLLLPQDRRRRWRHAIVIRRCGQAVRSGQSLPQIDSIDPCTIWCSQPYPMLRCLR